MGRVGWLLGLAAAAMASQAAAEEWVTAATDKDGVVYEIDVASVALNGSIVKAWERDSYKRPLRSGNGEEYTQVVTELFHDCQGHRYSVGVFVGRDEKGRTVETASGLGRGWQDIVPGSVSEAVWRTACAIASPPKEKPFVDNVAEGEWDDLGPSADRTYHLNVRLDGVIKLEHGYVAALMRTDYQEPTLIGGFAIRYVITAEAIDCASGESATIGGDFYVAPRVRVAARRTPTDKLEFHPLRPRSFIANGLKLICASARTREADAGSGEPSQGGLSVGTAWGVSKGYLVTAAHVVEGARRIVVYDNGERVGEARVVAGDPANDLAILKFTPSKPRKIAILPIAPKSAALGRSVFVLGYPAPDVLGQHIKMTAGQVSSTAGLQDDARFLQISIPVQPGNSGGPVIAWDGSVVGVVESGLTRLGEDKDGPAPQMVNYALKASYVRPMLDDLPDLANYVAVKPVADHDQMVAEARKAVFMVVVSP